MPTMHTLEDYSDLIKSYIDAKDSAKADVSSLGTAAAKDVPSSGNASTTQVVMGNDTRLSDSRNAKDVSSWAKASSKPTYNGSEIKTNAAKTGSGTTVTSTIAASTTMDNAIGTLLNNDVAENTAIQNLSNQVSSLEEENGYYNLCPPLTNILTGTDMSWQLKDDMSSVANGTATSMNQIATEMFTLEAGTYKINGLPSGGGTSSTFKMWLLDFSSGTETALVQMTGTSDYTFTVTANNKLVLRADVYKNYTASNLNFKPMIRKSDRTSNTYIPYRAKNLKLTQKTIGLIDNQNVNGAVNMLPNNATTQVAQGVTYTVNDDGSLTANGTATGTYAAIVFIANAKIPQLKNGETYKICGCPSGGSDANYEFYVVDATTSKYVASDYGNGATFTYNSSHNYNVGCVVRNGKTVSNLVFKPMISLASLNLSYDDYVPYAKSNKELTEDNETLLDFYNNNKPIDAGDTISFSIAVGYGVANSTGDQVHFFFPLARKVKTPRLCTFVSGTLGNLRGNGQNITNATIRSIAVQRDNLLSIAMDGTFTPYEAYVLTYNQLNVTVNS